MRRDPKLVQAFQIVSYSKQENEIKALQAGMRELVARTDRPAPYEMEKAKKRSYVE